MLEESEEHTVSKYDAVASLREHKELRDHHGEGDIATTHSSLKLISDSSNVGRNCLISFKGENIRLILFFYKRKKEPHLKVLIF